MIQVSDLHECLAKVVNQVLRCQLASQCVQHRAVEPHEARATVTHRCADEDPLENAVLVCAHRDCLPAVLTSGVLDATAQRRVSSSFVGVHTVLGARFGRGRGTCKQNGRALLARTQPDHSTRDAAHIPELSPGIRVEVRTSRCSVPIHDVQRGASPARSILDQDERSSSGPLGSNRHHVIAEATARTVPIPLGLDLAAVQRNRSHHTAGLHPIMRRIRNACEQGPNTGAVGIAHGSEYDGCGLQPGATGNNPEDAPRAARADLDPRGP